MVATAPREKLLIGRRPVRNWTRRTISSLFWGIKLHLFLGKSTKTAATRAAFFDSNMHQIVCRLGLSTRPHCGSLQRFRGLLLKGGRGDEERGGERMGGRKFVFLPKEEKKEKSALMWLALLSSVLLPTPLSCEFCLYISVCPPCPCCTRKTALAINTVVQSS